MQQRNCNLSKTFTYTGHRNYKATKNNSAKFMHCYLFFKDNIPYEMQRGPPLRLPPVYSTYFGRNKICFQLCLVWNRVTLVYF